MNYRFDDIGNADRLIRVLDGRARYVPALKSWFVWNGTCWVVDSGGQIDRWAVKAVNSMEEELGFGDPRAMLLLNWLTDRIIGGLRREEG